MLCIKYLYLRIFCREVGRDGSANRYFLGKKRDYLCNRKRYIWYSAKSDSSTIPPQYHAWMHYLTDSFEQKTNFYWQIPYMPNNTGTSLAYKPYYDSKNSNNYLDWKPN